ncbi:hypothetical protein [Alteromonas sp. 009811495]|uniref:hypothetical protein n=1 Tax=Alteromonas sp. 009811495 TaxID=3002962 RepID=UPI00237E2AF2|nr:hypothetical protein [Alteromonas sp. 009811495]WDT86665.1 hypothetical protein OZ660_02640 [Alteromonas sp. 009811495]
MNSFNKSKMNIIARSTNYIGLLGVLVWALTAFDNQQFSTGNKSILFAWLAIILFLHFLLGLITKEIAFGQFVIEQSKTEIGYITCLVLMGLLSFGLAFLAYAI